MLSQWSLTTTGDIVMNLGFQHIETFEEIDVEAVMYVLFYLVYCLQLHACVRACMCVLGIKDKTNTMCVS